MYNVMHTLVEMHVQLIIMIIDSKHNTIMQYMSNSLCNYNSILHIVTVVQILYTN